MQHNGITYPIFTGTITSWEPNHLSANHATVTVNCVDAFDQLAGYDRPPQAVAVGAGEDSGARVNRILDSVGWPAALRDIRTGDSLLQATLLEGDALAELQDVARDEIGELYVDPDGKIYFRNRRGLLTDARSVSSQGTFGSGPGEVRYAGPLGISYDKNQMVNVLRATRVGGVEQTADDPESRARYRDHVESETDLLLQTDAEVLAWAKYVLRTDSVPEMQYTSLTLDGRLDSDQTMPHALGRRLGDRITVVRRPPGVVDTRQCFIRSISHSWSPPDQWKTSWGLTPASKYSFFIIGNPVQGRIGRNALAY